MALGGTAGGGRGRRVDGRPRTEKRPPVVRRQNAEGLAFGQELYLCLKKGLMTQVGDGEEQSTGTVVGQGGIGPRSPSPLRTTRTSFFFSLSGGVGIYLGLGGPGGWCFRRAGRSIVVGHFVIREAVGLLRPGRLVGEGGRGATSIAGRGAEVGATVWPAQGRMDGRGWWLPGHCTERGENGTLGARQAFFVRAP